MPVAQYPVKALLSYPDSNVPAWSPPATKRHTAENKAKRKLKDLEADSRYLNYMREKGAIYGSHNGVVLPYFSSLIGPPCYYAVAPEVLLKEEPKPIEDHTLKEPTLGEAQPGRRAQA